MIINIALGIVLAVIILAAINALVNLLSAWPGRFLVVVRGTAVLVAITALVLYVLFGVGGMALDKVLALLIIIGILLGTLFGLETIARRTGAPQRQVVLIGFGWLLFVLAIAVIIAGQRTAKGWELDNLVPKLPLLVPLLGIALAALVRYTWRVFHYPTTPSNDNSRSLGGHD